MLVLEKEISSDQISTPFIEVERWNKGLLVNSQYVYIYIDINKYTRAYNHLSS